MKVLAAALVLLTLPLAALAQCAGGVASATYAPAAAPVVGYDVSALCQQAVATCVPQAPVAALPAYAPPVVQQVPAVTYSVPAAAPVYAAPVLAAPAYYATPVVRSFAVPAYSYGVQQSFAVRRSFAVPSYAVPTVVNNNFVVRQRGFGGGFGGGQPGFLGQIRANAAQGAASGGLLGAAERVVGVGDGSGQFLQGALIARFLPGGGGFRFKR